MPEVMKDVIQGSALLFLLTSLSLCSSESTYLNSSFWYSTPFITWPHCVCFPALPNTNPQLQSGSHLTTPPSVISTPLGCSLNPESLTSSSAVQLQKNNTESFFFLTSLLEYNCFTMVCQFLLYNKVNQLYIYICSHIPSLLYLPPSHPPYPTPLGGHKAPS